MKHARPADRRMDTPAATQAFVATESLDAGPRRLGAVLLAAALAAGAGLGYAAAAFADGHEHAPATASQPAGVEDAAEGLQALAHGLTGKASMPAELAGYHALLRNHVDPLGFVDYDALGRNAEALYAYTAWVADADFEAMPEGERLAQLINAYNAYTLQLILENYDDNGAPQTITALADGKPWDQTEYVIAGKAYSLNQIEHELIRPVFDEPRIHWALVCAAYSCPPLRAEAYTADKLETQLADQEHRVLTAGDPRFLQHTSDGVIVTQLFNWYGGDFGAPADYIAERIDKPGVAIAGFLDYDWKLNSRPNAPEIAETPQ
ncbi:MAG: DUF547 domain-containing protein [Planctomycetota bacterium]